MTIVKKENGSALELVLEGRLDTVTAPMLEQTLKDSLNGVEKLTLDFEKLDYISSAGLRVLLQGEMKLVHVNEIIMEIFEVTGFADILTVE